MNKKLIRLLVCVILLGFGFLFLVSVGDYSLEIEKLQEEYLLMRISIAFLGSAATLSTFCFWGLMFYHLGNHVFRSIAYKRFWFLVMLLGMFVGAWFYYVIVFELGKTVIIDDKPNSKEYI